MCPIKANDHRASPALSRVSLLFIMTRYNGASHAWTPFSRKWNGNVRRAWLGRYEPPDLASVLAALPPITAARPRAREFAEYDTLLA
jgi:hypothetical protein